MSNNATDTASPFDEGGKPLLPSGINILTILTLIACAIQGVMSVFGFVNAQKNLDQMVESRAKFGEGPGFIRSFFSEDRMVLMQKMVENKIPILILSLVAVALCAYGAMQMRKLKKQGYLLWLIGELLPVATTIIFAGIAAYQSLGVIFLIFPILFIILYTAHRKYLIHP